MKRFYLISIVVILAVSACDSGVSDDPLTQYDFTALDAQLNSDRAVYRDKLYVAIKQGNEFLYEYSAGGSNIDTVFDMASATKWISGAVILILAEQGYLSLDDQVGDHLRIFSDQGKGHFTIRHAFSMASGLFDASRPHTNPALTLEQSVNFVALNTPFIFSPPNTAIAYDGKQMQVAGRIAEVVTGKDWRTIAIELLFDPCGMHATQYNVFGDTNPAVAGGLSTTAADYLKFLNMIMSDGVCGDTQVLSAETIQEMFTNHTNNAPVLETPWPSHHPDYTYGNDDLRYGFGSWILAENPDTNQVEELTSPGAWGAFPWLDKRRNVYGVIFTYVPLADGGFQATLDSQPAVLKLVRETVDNN